MGIYIPSGWDATRSCRVSFHSAYFKSLPAVCFILEGHSCFGGPHTFLRGIKEGLLGFGDRGLRGKISGAQKFALPVAWKKMWILRARSFGINPE